MDYVPNWFPSLRDIQLIEHLVTKIDEQILSLKRKAIKSGPIFTPKEISKFLRKIQHYYYDKKDKRQQLSNCLFYVGTFTRRHHNLTRNTILEFHFGPKDLDPEPIKHWFESPSYQLIQQVVAVLENRRGKFTLSHLELKAIIQIIITYHGFEKRETSLIFPQNFVSRLLIDTWTTRKIIRALNLKNIDHFRPTYATL